MRRVTTKAEVRAVLRHLDQVLSRNDHGSKRLWDIVTALRGPDDDIGKGDTVAVRRSALPRCAKKFTANLTVNGALFDGFFAPVDRSRISEHFRGHVDRARTALTHLASRRREWTLI